jgi:hypothetical protein
MKPTLLAALSLNCAANLRYMTEKSDTQDARARKFVNHHKADKAYFYLHSTICYAMYSMNSETPKTAKMFQRTLNSMKPYERRYGKKLP